VKLPSQTWAGTLLARLFDLLDLLGACEMCGAHFRIRCQSIELFTNCPTSKTLTPFLTTPNWF
jgi:hypothetical protein